MQNTNKDSNQSFPRLYFVISDLSQVNFSWLDRDFKKGELLYEYLGCTYGCIGSKGIALTEKPNELPFFELPADSVESIG